MCLEQWKDPPLGSLAEPGHAKFDSANSPSIVLDLSDKLGARVGLMAMGICSASHKRKHVTTCTKAFAKLVTKPETTGNFKVEEIRWTHLTEVPSPKSFCWLPHETLYILFVTTLSSGNKPKGQTHRQSSLWQQEHWPSYLLRHPGQKSPCSKRYQLPLAAGGWDQQCQHSKPSQTQRSNNLTPQTATRLEIVRTNPKVKPSNSDPLVGKPFETGNPGNPPTAHTGINPGKTFLAGKSRSAGCPGSITPCLQAACRMIWVCLKIGYTPNYSHLVGIMIINHWV